MMRVKHGLSARIRHSLLLLLLSSEILVAGALPPCLKAVASKHGTSLLTIDQAAGIASLILNVFPRENWINEKDRIMAPATYWTNFLQWSIVLPAEGIPGWTFSCPLPLVTDDGEFVVIVSRDVVISPDREALRIYRRRDHVGDPLRPDSDQGVFIRAIPFHEILSPERIDAHRSGTDHSPHGSSGAPLISLRMIGN